MKLVSIIYVRMGLSGSGGRGPGVVARLFLFLLLVAFPWPARDASFKPIPDMEYEKNQEVVGEVVMDGEIMEVVRTTEISYHYRRSEKGRVYNHKTRR